MNQETNHIQRVRKINKPNTLIQYWQSLKHYATYPVNTWNAFIKEMFNIISSSVIGVFKQADSLASTRLSNNEAF